MQPSSPFGHHSIFHYADDRSSTSSRHSSVQEQCSPVNRLEDNGIVNKAPESNERNTDAEPNETTGAKVRECSEEVPKLPTNLSETKLRHGSGSSHEGDNEVSSVDTCLNKTLDGSDSEADGRNLSEETDYQFENVEESGVKETHPRNCDTDPEDEVYANFKDSVSFRTNNIETENVQQLSKSDAYDTRQKAKAPVPQPRLSLKTRAPDPYDYLPKRAFTFQAESSLMYHEIQGRQIVRSESNSADTISTSSTETFENYEQKLEEDVIYDVPRPLNT